MTTITRQRNNYVRNPRGTVEHSTGALPIRRTNRATNPRASSAGAAPTGTTGGTVGTVTRAWSTTAPAGIFPGGITTARSMASSGLGGATTDYVADYIDVPVVPGEVLTVSVYVRRALGSALKRGRLRASWVASGVLGAAAAADAVSPTLTASTTSRRLSLTTAAAPAATTALRVFVQVEGNGGGTEAVTLEWSALLVELTATLLPYFDGATPFDTFLTDYGAWTGTAHASTSTLASVNVYAKTTDGTVVRAYQPQSWDSGVGDTAATAASWYRWTADDGVTNRIHPLDGGTTLGPVMPLEPDATKPATFAATLLVTARREVPGSAVRLVPRLNGTVLVTTGGVDGVPVTDEWVTYRVPATVAGLGAAMGTLRIGKTGTDALLVREVALIDEAAYAGPYFDGNSVTVGVLASVWTEPHEAPNSASYQGIPSLSLTATAEPAGSNYPPRARIVIADVDPDNPARELAVERIDSSGRRTPVRASGGDVAELSEAAVGTGLVLYDYEAPYGESVNYAVAATTDPLPSIPSARVTVDSDVPRLIHPGVPPRSIALAVAKLGTRRRRSAMGVFDVVDRGDPITRTDGKRKTPESELVVRTYTDAERLALDALLDDNSVLLLNIPPGRQWGVSYEWVAIGDSDEDRTAHGSWPRRVWALPYRVVGRPIGGTRSARTWRDVALEASSWTELARIPGYDSWTAVADPTTPPGT